MNYSNYIAQFVNPEANVVDKFCRIFSLVTGTVNIILVSYFVFLTKSDRKRFHRNFCILRFHMLLAFFSILIPHFCLDVMTFITNSTNPTGTWGDVLVWGIIVSNLGSDLLRYIWIAFIIERYYATVYSYAYENQSHTFLPIILTLFSYGITGVLELIKYYFTLNQAIVYSIMFISDIVGLISIYLLYKYNHHLRKINPNSNVVLTQRYQITENIRALQLLFPIILMGACVTTSGTILRVITTCVIDLKWIFRYAIVLYYGFFNLYIFISLITWMKNDHIYRKRINQQIVKKFQRHNRTVPSTTTQDKKLIFKNVEGKIVITDQSAEIYFSNLNYLWADPNVNTKNLT